jgi:DNA-binding transcriptional LysR family regulator
VEAHNDELISMVRTNQIEFALATMLEPAADLTFRPLIADSFCAVFPAGHELAARPNLHWRDLVPYDLILLSQGSSARTQFDLAVLTEAAAPAASSRYDVTHMTTAAGLVRQGLGITLLPRLALPELNLSGLLSKPLDDASAHRTIGLLQRHDRSLSPAAQAFAAQLDKVAGQVEKSLPPLHRSARKAAAQRPSR